MLRNKNFTFLSTILWKRIFLLDAGWVGRGGGVQFSLKNNQFCGKYFFVVNALATPSNMLLNS